MGFSLEEGDAICAAKKEAGTVGQVGYMKVYDPAFKLAQQEVGYPGDVRFVQVNHLHPSNSLHLKQFELTYFDDLPPEAGPAHQKARQAGLMQAVGDVPEKAGKAFFWGGNCSLRSRAEEDIKGGFLGNGRARGREQKN